MVLVVCNLGQQCGQRERKRKRERERERETETDRDSLVPRPHPAFNVARRKAGGPGIQNHVRHV